MNTSKKPRKKKKKTTRREFLTTAGALAAGTVVAGNALAQELKRKILAPKVAPKAQKKVAVSKLLTRKVTVKIDKEKHKAYLARAVTTPSGMKLTREQIRRDKELLKPDIKLIAQKIVDLIDKGFFDFRDVPLGFDDMLGGIPFDSLFTDALANIKTEVLGEEGEDFEGGGCCGPGSNGLSCGDGCEGGEGWGCGDGCSGPQRGLECGDNCPQAPGYACGNGCENKPDDVASSDNPFINAFINDVPDNFNYLNPAVNMILQSYSHDILAQVMSRMLDPTRLKIK